MAAYKYNNVEVNSLKNDVGKALEELTSARKKIFTSYGDEYDFDTPVSKKIGDSLSEIAGSSIGGSIGALNNKLSNISTACSIISTLKNKYNNLSHFRRIRKDYLEEHPGATRESDKDFKKLDDQVNNCENSIRKLENDVENTLK